LEVSGANQEKINIGHGEERSGMQAMFQYDRKFALGPYL
jgi:hypothetical protein